MRWNCVLKSDTFVETSLKHYNDVIMGAIASQITSLMIVYSMVYSDADQRKHQSSALLCLCAGNSRTSGQLRGNFFLLMTSSWRGNSISTTKVNLFSCRTCIADKCVFRGSQTKLMRNICSISVKWRSPAQWAKLCQAVLLPENSLDKV